MNYYLAFDVGTTAMKAVLYNEDFQEIFVSNNEYDLLTPEDNVVELDSEEYIRVFKKSVRELFEIGIRAEDIRSLTFTTQGETLVPIGKDGKSLTNAIVWLDSRAGAEAEYIKTQLSADEIYRHTGLGAIDGALPAAKILWIYKNRRDIYDKTDKFMLLEDYLIFRLCGIKISNPSLLSSCGWFDIFDCKYYDKMLEICNIDSQKLPEIVPCGTVVGNISGEMAAETGLSEKTAVTTGAMDQIASAIGAGNISDGIVTETTGTALVIGATVEKPNMDCENRITVYRHYDNKFLYMPYCRAAGIVLKWFKDNMMSELATEAKRSGKSAYALIDALAEKSEPGSGGVVCFPYFAGNEEMENAKGVFFGLSLKTGKCELARSVLEGIAYMLRDCIELLRGAGVEPEEIRSLGGGSYSDVWTAVKAGVCGVPIVRMQSAQSTALGAAILGAAAVNSGKNAADILKAIKSNRRVEKSEIELVKLYDDLYENYRKLYKAFGTLFE